MYDWNIGPSSSNATADGQAPTTAVSTAAGAAAAGGAAPAASSTSSSIIFAPDGPMVAAAMHNGGGAAPATFFERITRDMEIVRVALLLTGCVQGALTRVCPDGEMEGACLVLRLIVQAWS